MAPDIIHDAILKILAGDVPLPMDRQRAWRCLLTTIRNVARNHGRTEKAREGVPLDSIPPSPGAVWDGREWAWRLCRRLEVDRELSRAMRHLTSNQRDVVALRYFEEWTLPEVAANRGCSVSAVKQLSGKAMAKLREAMYGRLSPE